MNGSKPCGLSVDERTSGGSGNAVRTASVTFPLTPSLSPKQRENPPLPFSTTRRGVRSTNLSDNLICRRLFPLPAGEGQGEGNQAGVRYSDSDHSRNCRTLRVLRQSRKFPKTMMKQSPFTSAHSYL